MWLRGKVFVWHERGPGFHTHTSKRGSYKVIIMFPHSATCEKESCSTKPLNSISEEARETYPALVTVWWPCFGFSALARDY